MLPKLSLAYQGCDSDNTPPGCDCINFGGTSIFANSGWCFGLGCGYVVVKPTPGNVPISLSPTTPDPVNIFTGESYFSSTDFSISGRGPKLALFRQYRSFSNINGIFGYGWRTDFDINLTGNVAVFTATGTELDFISGSGIVDGGNFDTLTQNADNTYTLTDPYGTATHYDLTGRMNSITDRNGNVLTFVYNPQMSGGTYIQDASGRRITLNFDTNGHVISAVDPTGKTYQYGYDTYGNLVSITDPTGAVTNYQYDANHHIIQFTNSNGHHTYYQYDSQGRCVMTWQDNNINKESLSYQSNNTTVVTDSLGNNNTYVFNNSGELLSRTDPLGNVTQQVWNEQMQPVTITDPRNNVTNFNHYLQNVIQITDPKGNQTNITYTSNFNLISSITDALNNTTNYAYDGNGNLTGVTDPLGSTHSYIYDQYGDLIQSTDSRGNSTNFIYDTYGDVIQKIDAEGNRSNFTYE